ncbi:MAG: hypothetical protein AB7T18_12315 [Alphaproteobacteria bacterium]
MLDDSAIRAAVINTARHNFGPEKIVRAIVEPWSDWLGNDAVRVTLVIAPDADLSGRAAADTSVQVNQQLLRQGEERRAFIFYATEDELADSGDTES